MASGSGSYHGFPATDDNDFRNAAADGEEKIAAQLASAIHFSPIAARLTLHTVVQRIPASTLESGFRRDPAEFVQTVPF